MEHSVEPVPQSHDDLAEESVVDAMTLEEWWTYLAEVPGTWTVGS